MEEISPNNILEVSHISASYQEGKQRKTVLHDISFELHENEILGLVGESGCGKSTLSKVILGFIRPDEGEIISQVDHPQMIFPGSVFFPESGEENLLDFRGAASDAESSKRRTKKAGSCDGRKSRSLRRAPETPPA